MHRKNGTPIIVPHREPQGVIDNRVYCTERGALCLGCPYPRHGFVCWFSDGTCLKTEYNRLTKRSGVDMKDKDGLYQYTLKDCACKYCLYYPGKGKPCPLDECCCAEEKRLALEREKAAGKVATKCRA